MDMEKRISDRMRPLNPSAIREIFKFAGLPGMISFAGGNPSEKTFPAEELAEVSARLFREQAGTILQYGITEGYAPLRALTKERMRAQFGVGRDEDDVLITTGSQQGLDMALKCLTNEGDGVVVETVPLQGLVKVQLSANPDAAPKTYNRDDVKLIGYVKKDAKPQTK